MEYAPKVKWVMQKPAFARQRQPANPIVIIVWSGRRVFPFGKVS